MATTTTSVAELKVSVADEDRSSSSSSSKRSRLMRAQWLRAAILGANDGLLSTTSLMLGVGAAKEDHNLMIVSGIAGAVAGACSMAVGEFVSVSTQRDIEQTTMVTKDEEIVVIQESTTTPGHDEGDHATRIGRKYPTASPARSPFMKVIVRDARAEEDHNDEDTLPNPYKAAGASALAFLLGSLFPILSALVFSKHETRIVAIVVVTTLALLVFGGAGARLGGSPVRVSAMRVLLGGWISMAVTYGLLKPLDREHDHDRDDKN